MEMKRGEWLYRATKEIRFRADREEVEEELRQHLEDKLEDLQRIFPGIPFEEAEQRLLDQMGDPDEIGRELARIHRPWWGYLWQASRVILAVLLAVNLFLWGRAGIDRFRIWWEYERGTTQYEYIEESYHSGVDPFGPDSPWYDGTDLSDTVRTPLQKVQAEGAASAGGYRFSVDKGALWSIHGKDEPDSWWLFCTLQADGLPWQSLDLSAAHHIRATDSLGNRYYSSYEIYELNVDRGEDGYVMVNPGDEGFIRNEFKIEVPDIQPGVEWLRLEYDRGGVSWQLTIPFKEAAG